MSKFVPSLSGIACLLWVVLWSWGLTRENNLQTSSAGEFNTPGIRIVEQDTTFAASTIFSFPLSGVQPDVTSEVHALLQQLAYYLNDHPGKTLILTGSYLPHPYERNRSPHPDLGIARADAIKNIIISEGISSERLKVASQEVQQHLIMENRLVGGVDFEFIEKHVEVQTAEAEAETANSPSQKKRKPAVPGPDKEPVVVFNYDFKDFSLAKNNRADLDNLRELVKNNPSFRLIITGFSTSDEEVAVTGLAERRSLAVRRYLVDTGVRRRNIIVESRPGAAKNKADRRVEITIVKQSQLGQSDK